MHWLAVKYPKKHPLLVWRKGMRITRSHFLGTDEKHVAVVLEATSAPPRTQAAPPPPTASTPLPAAKGLGHDEAVEQTRPDRARFSPAHASVLEHRPTERLKVVALGLLEKKAHNRAESGGPWPA